MFVIPIEHLSPAGVSDTFRQLLRDRVSLGDRWLDLFNESFATYWQRVAELAARAPQYWFPPRLQHVCVVTDPARVRPYFQPFNKTSWLLYATDFDPETSNCEFATFQFVQAERMGLLQEVTQTVVRNLSYWLLRSDQEVERFSAACRQARRPDAAAFRALAEALPWVRRLHHDSLKKPILVAVEPCVKVPHTGLLATRSLQSNLDHLARRWGEVAQGVVTEFHALHARRGRDRAGDLCA